MVILARITTKVLGKNLYVRTGKNEEKNQRWKAAIYFKSNWNKLSPFLYLYAKEAEVAQLVEHQLPKLRVAGSSPVFRSIYFLKGFISAIQMIFYLDILSIYYLPDPVFFF